MVMQIAWQDAIFEVPDHWEVTRYSIATQTGRIEFTGREGPLGLFSWETCTRIPDEQKILDEYHKRYLKEFDKDNFQNFSGFNTVRVGNFNVGIPEENEPLHAIAHIPDLNKLMMWSFPSYSKKKYEEIWRPILTSFRANDGELRKWSMFGINCSLPPDFVIDDAFCKAADVWLGFDHKNMHRIFMHRWGLPEEILRVRDMEQYFRDVLKGHEGRVLTSTKEDFNGMESIRVTAEVRGTKGMDRLYSSFWPGTGRIWYDKEEKRMYAWVQFAPKKIEHLDEKELLSL